MGMVTHMRVYMLLMNSHKVHILVAYSPRVSSELNKHQGEMTTAITPTQAFG